MCLFRCLPWSFSSFLFKECQSSGLIDPREEVKWAVWPTFRLSYHYHKSNCIQLDAPDLAVFIGCLVKSECVRVSPCVPVRHMHTSLSLSLSSFSLSSSRSLYSHTSQRAPMLALEFRYTEQYVNNFSVRPFWRVYGKGIIRKVFPFAFASIWLWLDTRLFFLFFFFFFNCYACWRGSWMTFYLF